MSDSGDFVVRLAASERCLDCREIDRGRAVILGLWEEVRASPANTQKAHMDRFLANVAAWVDSGVGGLDFLRNAQRCISGDDGVKPVDMGYRFFALGLYEFLTENVGQALRKFEMAEKLFDLTSESVQLFYNLAQFYRARCERRLGRYAESVQTTDEALKTVCMRDAQGLAAIITYTKAAALLRNENNPTALQLLDEAVYALKDCDDDNSRAAIEGIRARQARRLGHYEEAISHSLKAVELHKQYDKNHPSRARYLVSLAQAERLLAERKERDWARLLHDSQNIQEAKRELGRAIQGAKDALKDLSEGQEWDVPYLEAFLTEVLGPEKIRQIETRNRAKKEKLQDEIVHLRGRAGANLEAANKIYSDLTDDNGRGLVEFYSGLLAVDEDRLEEAIELGKNAAAYGEKSKNAVLRGRAELLLSIAYKACGDAQIEGRPPEVCYYEARRHGERALHIAEHEAHHDRLKIRSRVALADVLNTDYFHARDAANDHVRAAEKLRRTSDRDWAHDKVVEIRSKVQLPWAVDGAGQMIQSVEERLARGSSMKELTNCFMTFVVQKVYEMEHRKVDRVRKRLKMREKSIRTILRAGGLLKEKGEQTA